MYNELFINVSSMICHAKVFFIQQRLAWEDSWLVFGSWMGHWFLSSEMIGCWAGQVVVVQCWRLAERNVPPSGSPAWWLQLHPESPRSVRWWLRCLVPWWRCWPGWSWLSDTVWPPQERPWSNSWKSQQHQQLSHSLFHFSYPEPIYNLGLHLQADLCWSQWPSVRLIDLMRSIHQTLSEEACTQWRGPLPTTSQAGRQGGQGVMTSLCTL